MDENYLQAMETPRPFSMATANDPIYKNARFYQTGADGKPQEYLLPNETQGYTPHVVQQLRSQNSGQIPYVVAPDDGQPVSQYSTPGTIQQQPPAQYTPQAPYAVQMVQPVQYNYPQWLDTPESQKMQEDIYYGGGRAYLQAYPRNGKKDGVSVWADSIAPVVGQILGGRQIGNFLQERAASRRQQTYLNQQQAINALSASKDFLGALALKPQQKQADAQNKVAGQNQKALNDASKTAFTQSQINQRNQNNLDFRSYKFANEFGRKQINDEWNKRFAMLGLQWKDDWAQKNFDQREKHENNVVNFHKAGLALQRRGQDLTAQQNYAKAAERLYLDEQDKMSRIERDNAEMMFKVQDKIRKGDWPSDVDPNEFLMEFQNAGSVTPEAFGYKKAEYESLVDEALDYMNSRRVPAGITQPEAGLSARAEELGLTAPGAPQTVSQSGPPGINFRKKSALDLSREGNPIQRGSILNKPAQRAPFGRKISSAPTTQTLRQPPAMQMQPNPDEARRLFSQSKRNPAELKVAVVKAIMRQNPGMTQAEAEAHVAQRGGF